MSNLSLASVKTNIIKFCYQTWMTLCCYNPVTICSRATIADCHHSFISNTKTTWSLRLFTQTSLLWKKKTQLHTITIRLTMSCILCTFLFIHVAHLERSQLSYSKGTSWEPGCNYNVSHHFLQYGTDSENIFCVWWLNQCQRSALGKQTLNKKARMIIYCDFDNPSNLSTSKSFFLLKRVLCGGQSAFIRYQSFGKPPACVLFTGFLISWCQKCLALSKNCRRALWHFLLLQTSAVETRLVQGLM